jgi:glycerol-3-phosphate acyltransferase PlsX
MADGEVRIAIDAAGGDDGPAPVLAGAVASPDDVEIILVGPAPALDAGAVRFGEAGRHVALVEAPEVVSMGDDPVHAARHKRSSSLALCAKEVASGRADAMVTPGNTGAAVLTAAALLRRAPGVLHPALATLLPTLGGRPKVMLDVGAAVDPPPSWLAQFALLGSIYARVRCGITEPRIGLLANGTEEGKGDALRKDAHELLRSTPGYVGFVEGHDLLRDVAEVIVTDGFCGNAVLKTYEGTLLATAHAMLEQVVARCPTDTDGWVDDVVDAVRATFRVDVGAALLGLNGISIVCHGAARPGAIADAIALARDCVRGHLTEELAGALLRHEPPRRPAT